MKCKTLKDIFRIILKIDSKNKLPHNYIHSFHFSKPERERIFSYMLSYDIDYDYIKQSDYYVVKFLNHTIHIF